MNPTEPIEIPGSLPDGTAFEHPAFGQIAASRCQGKTTLYGSDFVHQAFVTITIKRSQLCRDLNHDWHFGRDELLEVWLSEAQWATFVSSLNAGDGTPCTLHHVNGAMMPGIPLRRQEDVVKKEFAATTAEAATQVKAAIAEIEGEIGRSLSAVKRERVLGSLRKLLRELDDHVPFMAKNFEEHIRSGVFGVRRPGRQSQGTREFLLATAQHRGHSSRHGRSAPRGFCRTGLELR